MADTSGNESPASTASAARPAGNPGTPTGIGLLGQYYASRDFTNLRVSRVDAGVDFFWDRGSPDPSVPADHFSVRLAGQRYDMRMEYFETTGQAGARLSWQSASIPRQLIPAANLFPPGT
jgi:hypothetical protein